MIFILYVLISMIPTQADQFDTFFTGMTFRFDYNHMGTAAEEHISLDQIRLEGDWPGSRTQLVDDTNLGKFMFEVYDVQTDQLIYSRGFASLYGEWETTGEARDGNWRNFHESMRFPEPKNPVKLVLMKRTDDGGFAEIFSGRIDPGSRFINRSPISSRFKKWAVFENGDPRQKVDLLILGDGYRGRDILKFHQDVNRLVDELFKTEPFKSRKEDFNVWAIDVVSQDSGVPNPRQHIWTNTVLGLSYNSFDSDRYVLTSSNKTVREIAATAPYDKMIILANNRKYGGGGIFNLYSTAAASSNQAAYLVIHEFGHSFAGLGDEYYTSQVAYEEFIAPGVEPWEVNVTALLDPENLKWKSFMDEATPIPTPWNQDAYDSASYAYQGKRNSMRERGATEEELEALFAEVKGVTAPMLQAEEYYRKVGAFEGSSYMAKGLYRPEVDCIMFTRNPTYYCRVCTAGIERIIDMYSR